MAKLILLSVIIASIAIPILIAERPRPQATVRFLTILMIVIIVVWSQLCLWMYPTLVPLDEQLRDTNTRGGSGAGLAGASTFERTGYCAGGAATQNRTGTDGPRDISMFGLGGKRHRSH